jgi:quercetin dioxygenase-like cupin family protein
MQFVLGEEDAFLEGQARTASEGVASKTLAKQGMLRVVLVALRKDAELSSHHAGGAVSVQTLRGHLRLKTERATLELPTGQMVVIAPGVVHSALAVEDTAVLLTVAMPPGE